MRLVTGVLVLVVCVCVAVTPAARGAAPAEGDGLDRVPAEIFDPDAPKYFSFFPSLERTIENVGLASDSDTVSDQDLWVDAGNVARFKQMKQLPVVALPVQFNLIFVGFQEDGNYMLNFAEGDLRPWFEHLEASIRHYTANRDAEDETDEYRETPIDFRYKFNVLELSTQVNTVLEKLLIDNLRSEEPGVPPPADDNIDEVHMRRYQMSSRRITHVLDSLIAYLKLRNQYTLFVLNPTIVTPRGELYGYRSGFNAKELELLEKHKDKLDFGGGQQNRAQGYRKNERRVLRWPDADPKKLEYKTLVRESEKWANEYLAKFMTKGVSPGAKEMVDRNADAELTYLLELAQEELADRMSPERLVLKHFLDGAPQHEDCLVDVWAAEERYAFIDLSAGPFQWGPVVSGEGVRTIQTLPFVDNIFQWETKVADHEAEEMEKLKQQSKETAQTLQDVEGFNRDEVMADIAVLQEYLQRTCVDAAYETSEICRDLRERIATLQNYLKAWDEYEAEHKGKGGGGGTGAKDDEGWIEADVEFAQAGVLSGFNEDHGNTSLAVDSFLSHLGAVVSNTLHMLVTPVSQRLPTFFPKRVQFHVYLIQNHGSYAPLAQENFDMEVFKSEMTRIKLPNQHFTFSTHKIKLADDPALAVAFASARRSAVVPTLKLSGEFEANKRMYIDSATLEAHLQSRVNQAQDEALHVRQVPVFLFSLDSPDPVFIDKYHQAVALDNMVIAVQSDFTTFESHLSCNGQPIYWNLRNPMRNTVASTLEFLGGVGPAHVTYKQTVGHTSQHWLWCVGSSPYSHTSHGWSLNAFQRDAVQRNNVAGVVMRALDNLNAGVALLETERTTRENYDEADMAALQKMYLMYLNVRMLFGRIHEGVESLHWEDTSSYLNVVLQESERFLGMARESVDRLVPYRCVEEDTSSTELSWLNVVMVLIVLVGWALLRLLKPGSNKAKLN